MPNQTLKTPSHTGYDPTFADWALPSGTARFGNTASIDCQLPGTLILPSRTYYVGFICAKANAYIVFPNSAYLYAGFWLNNDVDSYWIQGSNPFTLTGNSSGAFAETRSYKIYARTDRATSFLSTELILTDAPDDTDFLNGGTVNLQWDRLGDIGIISYDVWRETSGTFTLLQQVESGANTYIDNNTQLYSDAGYPTPTDDRSTALTTTRILTDPSVLNSLFIDGVSAQWSTLLMPIPIPYDYDAGTPPVDPLTDDGLQWLRIGIGGLTGDYADLNLPDVSVSSGVNVQSDLGLFTAEMVGLSVVIDTIPAGTIASFIDSENITLTDSFDDGVYEMYIIGGAGAHALLIDAVHCSYAPQATFSNNDNDLTPPRPQFPRAAPNGSNQGGTGEGGGNDGGGPTCVDVDELICVYYGNQLIQKPIGTVKQGDVVESGNLTPNVVVDAQKFHCADLWFLETENGCTIRGSPSHPIYRNRMDIAGIAMEKLKVGMKVLTNIQGRYEQSAIIKVGASGQSGYIMKISCSPTPSFVAGNCDSGQGGVLSHNAKPIDL